MWVLGLSGFGMAPDLARNPFCINTKSCFASERLVCSRRPSINAATTLVGWVFVVCYLSKTTVWKEELGSTGGRPHGCLGRIRLERMECDRHA
jgi:hypothetical protein